MDVLKTINGLSNKNSSGIDEISNRLLKETQKSICNPLAHIFSLSLKQGKISEAFKIANIKPLHKSGPKDVFTNYRPISILSSLAKVLEKIVEKQLRAFMEKENIIHSHQYGFRAKHQTSHALLDLLNKVNSGKIKNEHTIAVFLDLQKAYDVVPIDIILKKMEYYNIDGIELGWFQSYLTHRKQSVLIEQTSSQYREMKIGLPQGTVISPLVFLLFSSDLQYVSKELYSILFADDTAILATNKDVKKLYSLMNKILAEAQDWF